MKRKLKEIGELSVLIESLSDPVRVVRPDHTVAMANAAMLEKFGGNDCSSCYGMIGRAAPCESCLMKLSELSTDYSQTEKEIGGAYYSIKASHLQNVEGDFLGCIEVYRDITDEVRMRERLIRANAKMTEDLLMAQGLQKAMFRKKLPEISGYRLSMGFYPCDAVGGDACDCIILPDGTVFFYVADVSGHGVRAAMLTVFLRQEIIARVKGKRKMDLKALTEEIQGAFLELNADDATYITMFLLLLDPATGDCSYLNAGHSVAPMVYRKGGLQELFAPGAPVCRWAETVGSDVGKIHLEPGDRVALFTDGVMEECSGLDAEKFFRERFAEERFDAAEFIHEINRAHDGNRVDDILLMVCERLSEKIES